MPQKFSIVDINHGIVKIPNGELYYEYAGEGNPVILIHAGFSDRRDWHYQIDSIGKKFNTIIYDQRGSGRSSIITGPFTPAEDLKFLMDHLNINKTILVGHSFGGTIALDFALQYPDRVTALVLVASGINGYIWSQEYSSWTTMIWNTPQPDTMTERALSANFYKIAMGDPKIKQKITAITKESFQKILTWKTFDISDVHWFFPDQISKLKDIKIPILVIYGDQDSQDIQKIALILQKNLFINKIAQLKGADHLLNFEKPKELNALVIDFLDEYGSN